MNARVHFLMMARYNVWATRRLLEAVEALPDEAYRQNLGLFFKSIHGTLNHLLVGEHMLWYPRFSKGVSPKVALDMEAEPVRERLAQALKGGAANWIPLIESWPEDKFEGQIEYTTMRVKTAPTATHAAPPNNAPMNADCQRTRVFGM